MLPGIKFGPRSWKEIIAAFRPACCEVWFRIDWIDRYSEMFAYLKRERIKTGLHFWGILENGVMPNFAYPDSYVREPSLQLVYKTIDQASEFGFDYVNIHPGSYQLTRIDLDRSFMRAIPGRKTSAIESYKVLFENISLLDEYARKRETHLFVETLPCREPLHWRDLRKGRMKTQNFLNVPVSVIESLSEKGFEICNDFTHTAMDEISDDREIIFQRLVNKTKRLAKQTRLIHVNTMPPPFNGTDGHLGIRKQDFTEEVFPNREQFKKLLSLFIDRNDVWAIPEPFSDHIENTKALIQVLEEIKEER